MHKKRVWVSIIGVVINRYSRDVKQRQQNEKKKRDSNPKNVVSLLNCVDLAGLFSSQNPRSLFGGKKAKKTVCWLVDP